MADKLMTHSRIVIAAKEIAAHSNLTTCPADDYRGLGMA
jgi:hypothetical protein